MSDTVLKFHCKTTDLVNAIEEHSGVSNVVITSADDVKGGINTLLGIIEASAYWVSDDHGNEHIVGEIDIGDCVINDQNVFITLMLRFGKTSIEKFEGGGRMLFYEPVKKEYVQQWFVKQVKRLQEFISSAKKGV